MGGEVVKMFRQGFTVSEIALRLKMDRSVVVAILRAAELRGEV